MFTGALFRKEQEQKQPGRPRMVNGYRLFGKYVQWDIIQP